MKGQPCTFMTLPILGKGSLDGFGDQASWMGPAVVAAIERREGSIRRVWVRYRNKLKGLPLEFRRLAALKRWKHLRFAKMP